MHCKKVEDLQFHNSFSGSDTCIPNSDEDMMLITHPTTTTNFGVWKHGIACVWTPLKNYDDQV